MNENKQIENKIYRLEQSNRITKQWIRAIKFNSDSMDKND